MPKSSLMVSESEISTPRFPAIDAHNHLGPSFCGDWPNRPLQELVDLLDRADIRNIVNLDGGFSDHFYREMERWSPLGDRVLVFTGVGWRRLASFADLGERAAAELELAVKSGARGLKIWKDFGLRVRDSSGALIPVDSPRLDPLWSAAGQLEI